MHALAENLARDLNRKNVKFSFGRACAALFIHDMLIFILRWFAPNVDGHVLPDSPENLLKQGKFSKVPFVIGQTKDEGAFFFRLTINSFNNGLYDDNFIDHKLPRLLPVISEFNSKLYPITR